MFEPVKAGLGVFMQGFYKTVVPNTTPLKEFVTRGFPYCAAWAPSRMVDKVEDMLGAWQRNDTMQAATRPPKLPVMIISVAKDYTPIGGDFSTQIADPVDIMIPGDEKHRHFEMRLMAGEVRAQIAIFATDEPSAKSLAAQFLLYMSSPSNRGYSAIYPFAGVDNKLPVQFEVRDAPAMSIDTGAKNLTALAIDLTLRCSIPLFYAPEEGEANDNKGIPGTDDPAGYPLVQQVDIERQQGGSNR